MSNCDRTVSLESGFPRVVCGTPAEVTVCPFMMEGCPKTPLGTALHDAEEGEIVLVKLGGGEPVEFGSIDTPSFSEPGPIISEEVSFRPVVSEFLDSLTPEERKGAMKLLRKIQEVMFGG